MQSHDSSNSEEIPRQKAAWRSQLRDRAAEITQADREQASQAIVNALIFWLSRRRHARVCAFFPLPGEPQIEPLWDGPDAPALTFAFPRVLPGPDCHLAWHTLGNTPPVAGPFGIREPDPASWPAFDPAASDLILAPGLGFDISNGIRIGHGAGYYDRFLHSLLPRPPVVGVAYPWQMASGLPSATHDIPVDFIATVDGIKRPGGSSF